MALFPQCVAHAQEDGCARLDDPSERLACYDRRSGRAAADSRPIPLPASPAPGAAAAAAESDSYQDRRDALKSRRSEEHTSELQSLMRISYAVFCLKKKNIKQDKTKR